MWQCECGEFNNEESVYCVRCDKLRVIKDKAADRQQKSANTETAFRRIQDLVLLNLAVIALLVVYCLWRASQPVEIKGPNDEIYTMPAISFEAIIPVLFLVAIQMWLLIRLLRVFYRTAVNSERNSIFLQKIYEKYEGIADEDEDKESATQSLVKPPSSSEESSSRRGRGRPRDHNNS